MITKVCPLCRAVFETHPIGHSHSRAYCSQACQKRSKDHRREHIRGLRKRTQLKVDVLTHYGNGKLACVQCGFDNIEALCIDHINNDGYRDRSSHFYRTLRAQGFPPGYQTFCVNCNVIKKYNFMKHNTECKGEYRPCIPAFPKSSKLRGETLSPPATE